MIRVLVIAGAFLAAPACADPVADALDDLAKAEVLMATAGDQTGRRDALRDAIRAYEGAVAMLADQNLEVAARERDLTRSLAAGEAGVQRLLGGLARLGQAAEPVLLLGPLPPEDMVRSSILIRTTAERTARQVRDMSERRKELADLKAQQSRLLAELETGIAGLSAARLALIDTAADAPGDLPDISQDAQNLAALAIALDAVEPLDNAPADFPPLSPPLKGHVVGDFNTPDPAGLTRPGIAVAAPPGTLVTSPAAATIRYVGDLDSLGPVMILEPAPGALVVLAGITDPLERAGRTVAVGSPLGFLPGIGQTHEVFSPDRGEAGGKPDSKTLYIELRQNGRPVDPRRLVSFE